MAIDDPVSPAGDSSPRSRLISIYVGVLAVLLAICSMAGGNASKDALRANIDASNAWAFFQARNIRISVLDASANDLELLIAAQPAMPDAARAAISKRIEEYRSTTARWRTNPSAQDGTDELFPKARKHEQERDVALRQDPYFDYAQALLQIAIVLASVAIISGGNGLLFVSGALGIVGTLLMLNGFTLLLRVPFIG